MERSSINDTLSAAARLAALGLTAVALLPLAAAKPARAQAPVHLSGSRTSAGPDLASLPTLPPAPFGKAASGKASGAAAGMAFAARFDPNLNDNAVSKWINFGPYNVAVRNQEFLGTPGDNGNYVAGRVNAAVYDPGDISGGTFYVATAGGGLWRYKKGQGDPVYGDWKPLGSTFPVAATSCVAIPRQNPNLILVGTGDFDGGTAEGVGIMRSTNRGSTWINVGRQLGTVSSIAFDPENPNVVVATTRNPDRFSVRRTAPAPDTSGSGGAIWRSTDGGATWTDVTPQTAVTDFQTPTADDPKLQIGEGWSDVEFGAPGGQFAGGGRYVWAVNRRGGLYRSDDNGRTFRRVAPNADDPGVEAPIFPTGPTTTDPASLYFSFKYNPIQPVLDTFYPAPPTPQIPDRHPDENDLFRGTYGLELAVSATDPETAYVMDSNARFQDGRIWRTRDGGRTFDEITGFYLTAEGQFNNWTRSSYALTATAIPAFGPFVGGQQTVSDVLFGGARELLWSDNGGADWLRFGQSLSLGAQFHVDQHDVAYPKVYNAANRLQPVSEFLVANDGGVYRVRGFDPANRNPGQTVVLDDRRLNGFLGITQFYSAAFHPTQRDIAFGGTDNNGFMRPRANTPADPATGQVLAWETFPSLGPQQPKFSNGAVAGETPANATVLGQPGFEIEAPSTQFIPFSTKRWREIGMVNGYGASAAYDPGNPNIQYAATLGSGNLYLTTDAWGSALDITPDRKVWGINGGGNAGPLLVSGAEQYVFNRVNQQDSGGVANWTGESKADVPVLLVDGGRLYTGAQYLWRYDRSANAVWVPASATDTPYISPPNIDRGAWRRVGSTQLATDEGSFITAVAIADSGRRIYVGTSDGNLWMTRNGLSATGTGLPTLNAPWIRLNGPTLPSRLDITGQPPIRRAVTAISVNPDNQQSFSDILVTIDGAGVYRCANTLGSSFLFTEQNGTIAGQRLTDVLPGLHVRDIARDTISTNQDGNPDSTNSFFVATDRGVYYTNNQGSTWFDASAPLGLPYVDCRKLNVNGNTGFVNVATFGRGLWRFDLANAQQKAPAAPAFAFTAALSRVGNSIIVTVTLRNDGGTVDNVTIGGVQLATRAGTATSTNIQPSAALGTLGGGSAGAKVFTAVFPATAGARGETATLSLTGSYGAGLNQRPFPSAQTGNTPYAVRVRVP
jgi:hypothetical protein